jgi:hypothetical protein
MADNDGVCARSIDNVEIFQEFDREIALGHVCGDRDISRRVCIFEYVDFVSGWEDIGLAEFLTEQRIEKRRLTRLHFTHRYEQKRITEAGGEAL